MSFPNFLLARYRPKIQTYCGHFWMVDFWLILKREIRKLMQNSGKNEIVYFFTILFMLFIIDQNI